MQLTPESGRRLEPAVGSGLGFRSGFELGFGSRRVAVPCVDRTRETEPPAERRDDRTGGQKRHPGRSDQRAHACASVRTLLVLAALLAPIDLGLMRIATLTVAALVLFGAAVYGISILANGEMRRRLLAVSPL